MAALTDAVDGNEEYACQYFDDGEDDDEEEQLSADEVLDWQVEDVVVEGGVAFVALQLELRIFSATEDEDGGGMRTLFLPAYTRVPLVDSLEADAFDLDSPDLRSFVLGSDPLPPPRHS